ncbi:MAG: hypothetical protein ABIO02_01870 [Patescibacteria group bacterium]
MIEDIKIIPTTRIDPAFTTHANYVEFMRSCSENLSVEYKNDVKNKIKESPLLAKKVKLSVFTMDNLLQEMKVIENNKDYSIVCSSWVSVKSYYLIFNLFLILEYLITCREETLKSETHTGLFVKIKNHIKDGSLVFSEQCINEIYKCTDIKLWKFKAGNNLATLYQKDRDKQLIKKLLEYAKDEFKRKSKSNSLRGKEKIKFENQTNISLIDFFYWYRIKVNYRDLEFLDSNINEDQFYWYYKNYYQCSCSFYGALVTEINRLSTIRLSRKIFS